MDLIVGAGISGLSYAAKTKNDYIIIEKDAEIGGYCKTIKQDGFIWDYSGHFFHFQDNSIKNFVMQDMNKEFILNVNKHTQIIYKNNHIDYPFQKNIHQLDKKDFIDCLYDLFNNPYTDSSTFQEMLYTKFGKSISEAFLIPYNEKLYACDLNELDPNAMGRFFPYADKLDIIANFKSTKENSYNSSFVYPMGGAIEYVNAVYKKIDASKLYLNEALVHIDTINKIATTTKREIKYDNLISSIPLPNLLEISSTKYNKKLYTSNKVLVFNLGFDKKSKNESNHWVYIPEKKYIFYRIGFYDNIFNSDRLSVYVEIGFKSDETINMQQCLDQVLKDMKSLNIISDHKLLSKNTIVMNPAYVHITEKMEVDRNEKMAYLASQNIYSIGRYGGWCYCSIEDNIKEAFQLVATLE